MTSARLRWNHINADTDIVGCVILAVFGIGISSFGGNLLSFELRYTFDGSAVDAQVVNKWIAARGGPGFVAVVARGGGRREPRHTIRYEFHDDAGQVRTGQADIDPSEWQQLAPGATVTVQYVRSDPAQNRLAGRGALGLALALTAVGAAVLFVGLMLLRRRLRTINEQVRLTLTGRPVLGLIEEVQRHTQRKAAAYLIVRYRYLAESESGPQIHADEFRCADCKPAPWSAGEPILVLVDPADSARHTPDRFRARPKELAALRGVPAESTPAGHQD